MMNSFKDIFNEIYNSVFYQSNLLKNKQYPLFSKFSSLLKYSVNLWSKKSGLELDITRCNIFDDIQQASYSIWEEWKPKKDPNTQREIPNSKLYYIVTTFIDKSPLRSKEMNKDHIKFIVLLGLVITGVGFIIDQLNQKTRLTSDNDSYLLDFSPTTLPQKLILIVNALKKDCLEKIQNQGNKIQPEDCDKLYRATKFLWMGTKDELDNNFKNYDAYIAQQDQESEYDVYLVQIDLPEMMEGFKQDANTLERIDAFRELINLPIKISPRLKVSIYENTNVYTC